MAMLAEPRSKQKWVLNPRGKQWSEDSNKFGQKMLEKMGWSSGKGLGVSEQGMTNHIRVVYKNDQTGIGFKDTDDRWTRHQADFDRFLSQLQEQNSNSDIPAKIETERGESLELKAKQSRARVRYRKFTRGKDVRNYSAKDLANIFGKREPVDAAEASKVEEAVEEIGAEPTGSRDNTGGVLTIKGGCIDEYFKNKPPKLATKGTWNDADNSKDEGELKIGFGYDSARVLDESRAFGKNLARNESSKRRGEADRSTSGFAFSNEGLDLDYPERGNNSKRDNVDFVYDNPCLSLENREGGGVEKRKIPFSNRGFVNNALNLNNLSDVNNTGAEFEVSRVAFGLDNNALDLSDENNKKKRVTFNDKVEYNTDVVGKKKSNGKAKLDKFEVDNSKMKKMPREVVAAAEFKYANEAAGFVNEALDIEAIDDEINDNEMNERKTKKSKRKKSRRESNLETIEEIAEAVNGRMDESDVGGAVSLDGDASRGTKKLKKNEESETCSASNRNSSAGHVEALGSKKKVKKDKQIVAPEDLSASEEKSDERKQTVRKSRESEIAILSDISRKMSKRKRKKRLDESQSSDKPLEAIVPAGSKKKDKKRSESKSEDRDNTEVKADEAAGKIDITASGAATKRRGSGANNVVKSMKRSKMDDTVAEEDTENVEQNGDTSLNSISPSLRQKKGRTSRKMKFKSLFAKAPTLYFCGSNINEMAGYGCAFTEIGQ